LAWHWKQTDCWYYTTPGTKKRVPLLDEDGQRIRGKDNKAAAELAMARVKLTRESLPATTPDNGRPWLVARVCSEYLEYCRRSAANRTISESHHEAASYYLNSLCEYCGALPVAALKKRHVKTWVENHETWRSPATRRTVIAIVMTAFNQAHESHEIPNPLKGLKMPPSQPRLHSLSRSDEESIYQGTEKRLADFLFAAIHTGLRPFCELARITAENVEETDRGMIWRVYSSKTKKVRKVPVRPEIADLARRLMETAPPNSGIPLFRNTQGNAWNGANGAARFKMLRKKLGWDNDPVRKRYSCYSCRHTFAHRMLSGYWNGGAGCSIETLAELMGDTPKVAFDHYGKEWGQHYQDPLWAAIGAGARVESGPSTSKSVAGTTTKFPGKSSQKSPASRTSRPVRKPTAKTPAHSKGRRTPQRREAH
jgi:integrase